MIASVTLSNNQPALIGDALASVVDHVDVCIVIDTGITDDTLKNARHVAGRKLFVSSFAWTNDFSAARNEALSVAHKHGAEWALMVDTDERIEWSESGANLRSHLAQHLEVNYWMLADVAGTHMRERMFRMPATGAFFGPTHEAYIGESKRDVLPLARVRDIPKTVEQLTDKLTRDISVLEAFTRTHPSDPRWLYYLGDTFANLGRLDEAIDAFRRCESLRGWDEEAAWACYRMADCFCKLNSPRQAVAACARGMGHHAAIAELPWLAAYASYQLGEYHQAVRWARISLAIGDNKTRIGFRSSQAIRAGGYDVLRYALAKIGDVSGAADAEAEFVRRRA